METGRSDTSAIKIPFKKKYTAEQRKKECNFIRNKNPDRIPIILEKASLASKDDITLDKTKFLANNKSTLGEFFLHVKKRMCIPSTHSLIFIIGGKSIHSGSELLSVIYKEHIDKEDGYLYMTYMSESTFGSDL